MAILSFILCFATCLNQGYLRATSFDSNSPLLNQRANAIIEDAITYNFLEVIDDNALKSQLLSFNEEYDTLTSSELARMRMLASNPTFIPGSGPLNLEEPIIDLMNNSSFVRPELDFYYPDPPAIPDFADELPIYSCCEENISITLNGISTGKIYLGLYASPDACISFYNVFAIFINTFFTEEAFSILNTINNFYPVFLNSVITLFKTNIQAFFSLFGAGILSIIVGVIISVFALTALLYILGMIWAGFFNSGFFVGFIVQNYSWSWYNNLI